jgi:uncharacterized membrane protein SpoIIM required for sporulation
MKEISFIRQNIEKWRALETVVDNAATQDPGRLADAYLEITTDLSFSRSHYPRSRITIYLNNLASALHNSLYKNKKESKSRIWNFWKTEVPMVMHASRKELLISFLIFMMSAAIGSLSTVHDDTFTRLIMGNAYIDMTLNNIEAGNPMGVYGEMSQVSMFFMIVWNNVRVSFLTFVSGMLTSLATGLMLFQNGLMIGSFQTFFIQQHLGWESMMAVWLHGTLEISALIIAGAGGLALGNGWLFPGTYPRGYAFRRSAKRGLKIVVGTIPVFVIAGFVESFLTRYTSAPYAIRGSFILLSLAFVIYYYIFLPQQLSHAISKSQN